MIFPLYKLGAFGGVGLIIAGLIVGFIFGYVLEKGGFGNAKNIAAVFSFDFQYILASHLASSIIMLRQNSQKTLRHAGTESP